MGQSALRHRQNGSQDEHQRPGALERAQGLVQEQRRAQRVDDRHGEHDLAAAAGCSRFALYRAFRAEFGMAPSDYQRLLRLRRAWRLLTRGLPPGDAAASAGFSDQAHFNRWFKRAYGITPATYQRAAPPPSSRSGRP